MRRIATLVLAAGAAGLVATPAFAHPGHGASLSLSADFLHPIGGWDHLAAMVSVGLWSALAGGRARFVWPAAFVSVMVAGFGLGAAGIPLVGVEPAILASVILLGLATAAGLRPPLLLGASLVGVFALFHGYAHAVEGGSFAPIGFVAGFAAATALLHAAGLWLGHKLIGRSGEPAVRVLGGLAAVGGVALASVG